jgi:hypothetical protein
MTRTAHRPSRRVGAGVVSRADHTPCFASALPGLTATNEREGVFPSGICAGTACIVATKCEDHTVLSTPDGTPTNVQCLHAERQIRDGERLHAQVAGESSDRAIARDGDASAPDSRVGSRRIRDIFRAS